MYAYYCEFIQNFIIMERKPTANSHHSVTSVNSRSLNWQRSY